MTFFFSLCSFTVLVICYFTVQVVLANGKSERIMVANSEGDTSSQHAVTEYRVIGSIHERVDQLRVHCAEVLGTPIVGDFKYGWSGHRKWRPLSPPEPSRKMANVSNITSLFGLDLEGGSIMDQRPRLHLHCRQMILPNISVFLQQTQSSTVSHDFSKLESLELVAPLPSHMQKSWDGLNYSTEMIKTSGNTLAE
ncbi:hypothetical protein Taro_041727 [Colocasia esculenta]|uniref:Uncharacterized protein n=1 Tax=Colocasia esculenta TaxID=4460 RepID=A0A843WMJ2_COLES|nr:hypothetical protein [Colocasia esculenta]